MTRDSSSVAIWIEVLLLFSKSEELVLNEGEGRNSVVDLARLLGLGLIFDPEVCEFLTVILYSSILALCDMAPVPDPGT